MCIREVLPRKAQHFTGGRFGKVAVIIVGGHKCSTQQHRRTCPIYALQKGSTSFLR